MSEAHGQFDLVVHSTHEAGVKLGGIGAVLSGLLGARTYNEHIARTILVGPMDTEDQAEMERLTAPRNQLEIWYSSQHGVDEVDLGLSSRLRAIESQYNVKILYGTRAFGAARHKVILVDGKHAAPDRINAYKASLYSRFGIQSNRYERHPEYTLYVDAAEPSYRALQAIAGERSGQRFLIAHEFMGMPLCYSALIHDAGAYHTIFYGHEVATVRPIVEFHPGHDTMFYNVMARARQESRYLEGVFGDQSGFFKHGLIRPAATQCDNIFAVGDSIVREMRFLGADWEGANIDLVYNGVPSHHISLEDKKTSRGRLQQYCANLVGYKPDYVFTHVTRMVPSKGLWRDIRVMEHLAPLLAEQGKRAVLFVLSTIIPVGRPSKAIFEMEANYGWPVTHRETSVRVDGQDVPDLVSHEIAFYNAIEQFNRTTPTSKIILVNQFGWSRDRCGQRMPQDMTFTDIRQGSDLEFGQSIYEPFGIAQLEPLGFGALCVVSSVCGCLGFVRRTGEQDKANVIVADYVQAGTWSESVAAALSIDQARRDQIESTQAHLVALQIADRLPKNETAAQKALQEGYALSQKMSWEVVTKDYLLPGLARARRRDAT
jgi:glycosyltransferase involved in cell wall biosynthesis